MQDERNPANPTPPRLASWNSPLSLVGVWLALIGVILLITFGLFTILAPTSNPYVDIFVFLIVPGLIALGLVLGALGVFFRRLRIRRIDPDRKFHRLPRIDFNDPRQRKSAAYVGGFVLVMLPVVAVSSYHGYHFTDSVSFCAEACHQVMHPEAKTYEFSSHARVTCAECHIGSGASWFVKAKISGMRQVLAVATNSYSRPIPPAIHHLRPAADTCEQCHWPRKFHGAQLQEIARFGLDEENTRHDLRMLVKIGGGDEITGRVEGIHMHMLLSGRMEYVATDPFLQEIAWVRWTGPDGEVRIYRSDGLSASDPPPDGAMRTLDCMDCHNRPAHKFLPPSESLDLFLARDRIDSSIPFVKRKAIEVLTAEYPDPETARTDIANALTAYYRTEHPEAWDEKRASIEEAILRIQEIYGITFFPEMRVDWTTYPDNIGHFYSPGCFRCHDEKHVEESGESIRRDCDICHEFLNPAGDEELSFLQEGNFRHPYELRGRHAEIGCHRCHDGGLLETSCKGCHETRRGPDSAQIVAAFERGCTTSGCHGDVVEHETVHDPVREGMCDACHEDREKGAHDFRFVGEGGGMCTTCHEAFGGESVHAPVGEGECLACHDPHGSGSAGLLVADSATGLCLRCHDDPSEAHEVVHAPAADDCTFCHDPHASAHPALVKSEEASLCGECHSDLVETIGAKKHPHGPVADACTSCHDPHGAPHESLLAKEGPALCGECHVGLLETIGDETLVRHAPVSEEADCGACHEPHASDESALLVESPRELCFECHAGETAAAAGRTDFRALLDENPEHHAPVDDDCGTCHAPHTSEHARLLTDAYPGELYSSFSEDRYALCFACHDAALAADERTDSSTAFRNGDRNLHWVHVAGLGDRGRTCRWCHDAHAGKNAHLVHEKVPFGSWKMSMNFRVTETGGGCSPGCHKPYDYDREIPVPR
jgi:predicted CXXCH cytochrome family protein